MVRNPGLLLLASVLLAGCPQPSPPQAASSKVVGVTLLTQTHVFYQELEAGMAAEAKKQGLELLVNSAEFDAAQQASQLENFVTKKVAAIICSPVDSDATGAALKRAAASGIPVFTADIRAKEATVVCHVASDNRQGGKLLGEFLAKRLGGKGKVAVIDHPQVTSVQERVKGFEEAVKAGGLELVEKQTAEGQRQRAQDVAENLLKKYPDLAAIFGINDDSALGALRAVETSGKKDIIIVGYDATPEAREAILRGSALVADAVQSPKVIGTKVVEAVANYLGHDKIPAEIPVDVGLATKESLAAEKK